MAQVEKIKKLPKLAKRKRVAAYARVSSDKDAMLHSLSTQVSYYSKMIQSHPGWSFAGVYADEGLTGTKDNRDEFVRIVEDAKAGKIDLIITKSISRFARNTATLLQTVRELKAIGVDIFFELQNLHTMSSEGEMILTLIASMAQEESRQVSENQKWRIKKEFQQGTPWGGIGCYGYRIIDKKYVVVPEEAEIVKRIYAMYLNGMGMTAIAKKLCEEGISTFTGAKWSRPSVRDILTNVNYTGDLLLQKTYVENHLSKKTKRNKGEYQKYFVEDDHEAIVSRETFEEVGRMMLKRREIYVHPSCGEEHYFTGMLICDKCGSKFRYKKSKNNDYWICPTFDNLGKSVCSSKKIPEKMLIAAINAEFGYAEFNVSDFKNKVKQVSVKDNNVLCLHLNNGSEREIAWKDHSRKDSWTPEMREQARLNALKRYSVKEKA